LFRFSFIPPTSANSKAATNPCDTIFEIAIPLFSEIVLILLEATEIAITTNKITSTNTETSIGNVILNLKFFFINMPAFPLKYFDYLFSFKKTQSTTFTNCKNFDGNSEPCSFSDFNDTKILGLPSSF